MNRFWSILFFLVPILGTITFLMAGMNMGPFHGAWLPDSYSLAGDTIDHLFNMLHWISAVIFVGTGIAIGWFIWRYEPRRQEKAVYVSHNTRLELVWSVIPGIVLVFIAFYQMNSWADNKMNRPTAVVNGIEVPVEPIVLVRAKQFGWEFHYAGPDGIVETADDYYIENELVLPVDRDIVLQLESQDVIHSFFVPRLRLKQDIVPGMKQFIWFNGNQQADLDILCTELCGWGHYKMRAKMRLVSSDEYDTWIAERHSESIPRRVAEKKAGPQPDRP